MNNSPLKRFTFAILCALSVGLAPVALAEDEKIPEIKTASGKTYQGVRITKVTPSEISIIHESGVARIPLKDLPEDLKTKFGYDPTKAEAHAAAVAQADAQNAAAAAKAELAARQRALEQKQLKEAKEETFKVSQVIKNPKGVLANFYVPGGVAGGAARALGTRYVPSYTGDMVFLHGALSASLVDDAVIEAKVIEDGIYTDGDVTIKKLKVLQMKIYGADSK